MFKIIILAIACLNVFGCVTKNVCQNQSENLRSVYDVNNACRVRIKQVVIGSEANIPKSIDFKSGVAWTYLWQESKFENGKLIGGHFVLLPQLSNRKDNGNSNE